VRGVVIAAATPGEEAMRRALDTLFNHPNTGPFLARQLIQKLVTSNPSPGYVFRVAAAFANNGSGVRGDLFATLRAVLLDGEARALRGLSDPAYGKRTEPILRLTRLYRAFPPVAPRSGDPRLFLNYQYDLDHQVPLGSPSVFNFFQPVYAQPGRIATAGLVSPEFQITSETTIVGEANRIFEAIMWSRWLSEPADITQPDEGNLELSLTLAPELALLARTPTTPAQNFAALVDALAAKLLATRISPELRARLIAFHADLPTWYWQTNDSDTLTDRRDALVRAAIHLIVTSPEGSVDN
jgi:uncharacterized protein (DUF1800 family)